MKRGQIYRYIDRYIDGHRDSMKELAKGRFFENYTGVKIYMSPKYNGADLDSSTLVKLLYSLTPAY